MFQKLLRHILVVTPSCYTFRSVNRIAHAAARVEKYDNAPRITIQTKAPNRRVTVFDSHALNSQSKINSSRLIEYGQRHRANFTSLSKQRGRQGEKRQKQDE